MKIRQLEHQEVVNNNREFPIVIVCDNLSIAENVGMAFRLAEAMGVPKLCLCGSTPAPPNKKLEKVARSTLKSVRYSVFSDSRECIGLLEKEGYMIYCLEITSISKPIQDINFRKDKKIALVIGAENKGVQDFLLQKVHNHVHIPMYGRNTSMNVIQSLSMALYEITNQLFVLE